jgi:hypothetical protein
LAGSIAVGTMPELVGIAAATARNGHHVKRYQRLSVRLKTG